MNANNAQLVNRDGTSKITLIICMVSSEKEAYDLYNAYVYIVGFSIHKVVNLLASVLILSQVVKIKMEVQVSNPQGLWLYLSDANSIIKQ